VLTWAQAIFLALLQGFTELFPVSSLGHSVLLPAVLGWGNVQKSPTFVPFVVLLHLGTATALVWFYRDRWVGVIRAFAVSAVRGRLSHTPEEHLAWMLFFGTIPTGIIGAVLEHPLKQLFATPLVAAVFLIVNGGIMLLSERLRGRQGNSGLQLRSDEPDGTRGLAIARALHERFPEIPLVCASILPATSELRRELSPHAYLTKPFPLAALERALADALDGAS